MSPFCALGTGLHESPGIISATLQGNACEPVWEMRTQLRAGERLAKVTEQVGPSLSEDSMQLTSLPAPSLVPTTLSLVPSHEQLCSHCPVSSGSLGVASSEAQPRRPSLDCRICSRLCPYSSGPRLAVSYLFPGELCGLSYPHAGPKLLEGKVHDSFMPPAPTPTPA